MHQFTNIHAHKLYYYMLQSNTWILLGPWLSEIDINSRRHDRIILDAIHPAEVEYKDVFHIWINMFSFNQGVTRRCEIWIIRFYRKSIESLRSRWFIVESPPPILEFSVPHKVFWTGTGRYRLYGVRQAQDLKSYGQNSLLRLQDTAFTSRCINPGPLPLGLSKY